MITLKANTQFKAIAIDNDTTALVVTYAQAYNLAFELLNLLGKIRDIRPEDEPASIILYLPATTPADEDLILDPTRELVPDLETVFARIHRRPRP